PDMKTGRTKYKKKSKSKPMLKLKPGRLVFLKGLPPGFVDGFPAEEQRAIAARIGRPILFIKYDRDGRSELEFMDKDDGIHMLHVEPTYIRPW
ncbi:MAG: hypothetical protein WA658_00630, partial [Candidatus Acidiferrales bacterium]